MWRISILSCLILISTTKLEVDANPLVPCYFVFGDSLSDTGNNNGLRTKARANYSPYGIDFPGGKPTGRFTNGLTAVDVIAEKLGLGLIPPYSTVKYQEILKGVNYASGAAGILSDTGRHLGQVVTFDQQIGNHNMIIAKMNASMKSNGSAQAYLQKCLYTVNIGSNDYINNYFMPKFYKSSKDYDPNRFAELLVAQYREKLKILYRNGARKVAVFGLGLVGCTIGEVRQFHPPALCVTNINLAVFSFNNKLGTLVTELNQLFRDAKFTFINVLTMVVGPLNGVTVLNQPCCQLREDFMCKESTTPCKDRNRHYFWDGFHPTEAVLKIMGERAFKKFTPFDANPLDISSLVNHKL